MRQWALDPIYTVVWDWASDHQREVQPGRIMFSGHFSRDAACRMHPDLAEDLLPTDIVFVPLYTGGPERPCDAYQNDRVPGYDDNLAWIGRNAARVKAIMIGNAGPELAYKHVWWRDPARGPQYASEKAAEFARNAAAQVVSAGGRLAVGTMDWDAALDCYRGGGLLAAELKRLGALQIICCGYNWARMLMPKPYHDQVGYPEGYPEVYPDKAVTSDKCPRMREYLSSVETWSGVDSLDGLQAGNDKLLRGLGFVGGICGVCPG
jgi:hypothetical protein